MKKEILSRNEALKLLGVTLGVFNNLVKKGTIPAPRKKTNGYSSYWLREEIENVKKSVLKVHSEKQNIVTGGKFLNCNEARKILGLSRTAFYAYIKKGVIPQARKKANGYSSYWLREEIEKVKRDNIF